MKKTFTNEECQVIVHAVKHLTRVVGIISEHIYDSFDGETFAHLTEPYKDCAVFVKDTERELNKIQNRIQS